MDLWMLFFVGFLYKNLFFCGVARAEYSIDQCLMSKSKGGEHFSRKILSPRRSSFNHRFALGLIKEGTTTGKVISIKTFNDLLSLSRKAFW